MDDSPARIFLCYRRDDEPGFVGRLADRLRARFGNSAVFMDVDSVVAGEKWRPVLEAELESCDVILVLIGPRWMSRLDDGCSVETDDDVVKKEIMTALRCDLTVVPVLCNRAQMPRKEELPGDIREITEINAARLDHNSFEDQVDSLFEFVQTKLDLHPSLARRGAAFAIDILPIAAITAAVHWSALVFWATLVVYHGFLAATFGRTVGKLVCGTRIESKEPTISRWLFSWARPLFGYPVLLLTGIGAAQIVLHPQHVAFYDRLFRSKVIQTRRRPLSRTQRHLDYLSQRFDLFLHRLLHAIRLGFLPVWAKSSVEHVASWFEPRLGQLSLKPAKPERDLDPKRRSAAREADVNDPANASNGSAGSAGARSLGRVAVGSELASVASSLVLGLVLATASVVMYESIAPEGIHIFPDGRLERLPTVQPATPHDLDGDGLSNAEEEKIGTLAENADTDGDLLTDGFEARGNLNPLQKDDPLADPDGDGLSNLQESIYGSWPLIGDSDGDGVLDGREVAAGRSPVGGAENGDLAANELVELRLTVGDPSGSRSERYGLVVGPYSHQSPEFGVVASGEYVFRAGQSYQVALVHIATTEVIPDYDYIALIEGPEGSFDIDDPIHLLGEHNDRDVFNPPGQFVARLQVFNRAPK